MLNQRPHCIGHSGLFFVVQALIVSYLAALSAHIVVQTLIVSWIEDTDLCLICAHIVVQMLIVS